MAEPVRPHEPRQQETDDVPHFGRLLLVLLLVVILIVLITFASEVYYS